MNTNQIWPSQMSSTSTARRSSGYRGEKMRTDHASGILTILFAVLLIAGVLGGLWFFVLGDLFSQLSTLKDVLHPTQLAVTGSK